MDSKLFWWTMCVFIFDITIDQVDCSTDKARRVLNFTESAAKHGYKSEQHKVITEDGYVLTVFRLPKGKNCKEAVRHPPVLMMHGLLVTADSWIDSGPSSGLGYLLADSCFDLWLANARGNYYSRRHLRFNPDNDREFWKFSLHEVGFYDLPAIINYILSCTRSKKVSYIGYSQGGAALLMMCSERPSLCNNITVSILLHPASRMKHTESMFFRLLSIMYHTSNPDVINFEAFPYGRDVQTITANLCQDHLNANTWCRVGLYLMDSVHSGSIAASTIRTLTAHFPAGTSVKTLSWFAQTLRADHLRNFDYGSTINLRMYGSAAPPLYNINMTRMPVVIIHGENDKIVSSKDVEWLRDQLPNLLELFYVQDLCWNHLDTLFSRHNKKMIYPKIKEHLMKYRTLENFSVEQPSPSSSF